MNIYLAGGGTGNLRDFFMKIHLAESWRDPRLIDLWEHYISQGEHPIKNGKDMKLYLAGEHPTGLYNSDVRLSDINILETFYYMRKNEDISRIIPYCGSFLLDSGAFTFMQNSHKEKVDWDTYIGEYADFINRHNINLFFELDIDALVGLPEVERLRAKLEDLTGKKPIPVWHINRGKEYFIEMCKKYPYVAVGGLVTAGKSEKKRIERAFNWFIGAAHINRAKIHALGYTSIPMLRHFHFDSVDSTAWLYGNRGGWLDKFDPATGEMKRLKTPDAKRLKSKEAAMHNFLEWIKISKYAEKYW